MSRFALVVLAGLFAAGCASTPDETALSESVASAASLSVSGQPGAEAAAPSDGLEVITVDANSLDPGSVVKCKDMLRPASNVIQTRCMSRDDWKRYERAEALWAQQQLRLMQGGAYRF
jgi:hypothetical protein